MSEPADQPLIISPEGQEIVAAEAGYDQAAAVSAFVQQSAKVMRLVR